MLVSEHPQSSKELSQDQPIINQERIRATTNVQFVVVLQNAINVCILHPQTTIELT